MYKKRTNRHKRRKIRRSHKRKYGGDSVPSYDIENQLDKIPDIENQLTNNTNLDIKKNIGKNISVSNLDEYKKKHEELFQPSKNEIDIYHTWYKEPEPFEPIIQPTPSVLDVPMDIETNIKSDDNFNLGKDYGQYDTQFYGGISRRRKNKRRKTRRYMRHRK